MWLCFFATRIADQPLPAKTSHRPSLLRMRPLQKKVFNTKLLLVSHVKDSHMNALYCDVCKKKFYSETEFRQHKRIVCQSPGNWFCEICDKTFTRRKGLSSHLLFHSSTASYECDYCGKKFKLKNLLAIHIRRKHIKETRKVPKKQPKSLVFIFWVSIITYAQSIAKYPNLDWFRLAEKHKN